MRDGTSYRVIAPYYDWIMAHVDYDAWGRYLGRLWRRFGAHPRAVLELGAGTCPFARRSVFPSGSKVVYTDLSPYMLSRAADAGEGIPGGRAPLRSAANVLALPFKRRFDLALMIYDALNYVMTEDDLLKAFREVHGVLADDGLFLFDVTTEANSREHFEDVLDFGELEGCSYVRESRYDREARLQRNDFTFFVERGEDCWARVKESHQQRIWSLARLRAVAKRAGFEVEGCFDGFTFREGGEASERVHFALRKPAAPAEASRRARKPGKARGTAG